MPPATKRGPGRPKEPANGAAAASRKKKDKGETGKKQPTLTSFFNTPKTKPAAVAGTAAGHLAPPPGPKGKGGRGGERGSREPSANENKGPKETIDMTTTTTAPAGEASASGPGNGGGDSPSSAAKLVRFKLDKERESSPKGKGTKRLRQGHGDEDDADGGGGSGDGDRDASAAATSATAAAAATDDADEDDDVLMSDRASASESTSNSKSKSSTKSAAAAAAAAAGGKRTAGTMHRTPPSRSKHRTQADLNADKAAAATTTTTTGVTATDKPTATAAGITAFFSRHSTSSAGAGADKEAARSPPSPGAGVPGGETADQEGNEKEQGEEGFVTPSRSPPPPVKAVSSAGEDDIDVVEVAAPAGAAGEGGAKETRALPSGSAEGSTMGLKATTAKLTSSSFGKAAAGGGSEKGSKSMGKKPTPVAVTGASSRPTPPPPPPHPHLEKYRQQLSRAVASANAADGGEDRQDRRMGLQDAVDGAVAWKSVDGDEKGAAAGGGGARAGASSSAVVFPEHLSPLLARVVQGSPLPLSALSKEACELMAELTPGLAAGLTVDQVATKISLVAQRKCYGSQPRRAVIPEDTSPEGVWRWEVQLMDLLPADKAGVVKSARSERTNSGRLVKALVRLTEVMAKSPGDAAKISKEEEKVLSFARKEEALRQKASLKEAEAALREAAKKEKEGARAEERRAREEERRKRAEQKQAEKEAKEQERKRLKAEAAAAEEERKKAEEAKQQPKVSLFNFFKVTDAAPSQDAKENVEPSAMGVLPPGANNAGEAGAGSKLQAVGTAAASVAGGTLGGPGGAAVNGIVMAGAGVTGMVGAAATSGGVEVGGKGCQEGAVRRSEGGFRPEEMEAFERRLKDGGEPEELLVKTARELGERSLKRKALAAASGDKDVEIVRAKKVKVTVTVAAGGCGFAEPSYSEEKQVEVRNRMKLLQFHQDHRPAYWGTWSKGSKQVTGRRPLGRDTKGILNYDYDSEEDWEEEAQGEDLLSEEEVEPEDNLDYKDGWLRQDDEFSDEEIDRFDCGKSNNNANNNSDSTNGGSSSNNGGSSKRTIGFVGEGVRIGAGAAAGGGAAVSAAAAGAVGAASSPDPCGDGGPRQPQQLQQQQQQQLQQQQQQQAFVSAVMFRRGAITEEEMRAKPVLRVLSGYRAVPFPCCGGGAGGFPVPVMEAMVEKPRRKDTGDGGVAGAAGKEGAGEGKVRKFKDFPDELLPALVEKLHGKADKREDIVNAFVALHPLCTKKMVHLKVKDVATRERSLRGGPVYVVKPDVIERLGVEASAIELKPSQAEAAAAAAALKAEKAAEKAAAAEAAAAAAATAAGDGDDGAATTPGSGRKGVGGDKSKNATLPGQLSLLGFLQTAKGGSAGDSSPPSRATPKNLFGPTTKDGGAEDATAAPPAGSKGESGVGVGGKGGGEADGKAGGKGEGTREEGEKSDEPGDANPLSRGKPPGPDTDGGWEECKESEPPMGRPVPPCKILTPSKKVRQVAAARPVLYLGSGTPPPPRVILLDTSSNGGGGGGDDHDVVERKDESSEDAEVVFAGEKKGTAAELPPATGATVRTAPGGGGAAAAAATAVSAGSSPPPSSSSAAATPNGTRLEKLMTSGSKAGRDGAASPPSSRSSPSPPRSGVVAAAAAPAATAAVASAAIVGAGAEKEE